MRRPLLLAAVLLASALPRLAAEPEVSDSSLRINGIFNAALPGTERKNSLRLIVHPHFGDLTERDHIHAPIGFRYGLTERWEATIDVEGYMSHGLRNVAFAKEMGFSQYHFGTKYRPESHLIPGWETGVGIDYSHPLGTPPLEVTDGFEHISPFITFARPLESQPNIRVFWGVGADLVNTTSTPGALRRNQLGDDSVDFSGGLVWKLGSYHYTFEASWETTDFVGGPLRGNVYSLRPGVVWEVPARWAFHGKGQWLLGLGLRVTHGPNGTEFGGGAKVRVNFDFKQLLGRKKASAPGQ